MHFPSMSRNGQVTTAGCNGQPLLVTHVEVAKTWVWEVTRCYTKFQYKHGEVSQMWFCHLTP